MPSEIRTYADHKHTIATTIRVVVESMMGYNNVATFMNDKQSH
jgi:hypothetical protein